MFETNAQRASIQRWSRLAIQLNGAAESGRFDHVTTAVIVNELERDRVFEFLERELPAKVWARDARGVHTPHDRHSAHYNPCIRACSESSRLAFG